MHRFILPRLSSALVMVSVAGLAHASPVTWHLAGVTFNDGATASGQFAYDASTNAYSAWSLSVTGGALGAFTYDTLDSHLNVGFNGDATGAVFVANIVSRYFDLNFVAPLTNVGGTVGLERLSSPSFVSAGFGTFECTNCGSFRYVTAGSVTTAVVPEPTTALLAGIALVAARLARRRS